MKNRIQFVLPLVFLIAPFVLVTAQVAINPDNSEPDPSAMLDVSSTEKGILVPRMTTTQREAISSPATGLLVFDSTTESFWFYDSSGWIELVSGLSTTLADADGDTKIQVEESDDEDEIRIDLGGTEYFKLDSGRIEILNTGESVYIGESAGSSDDLSDNLNVGIGYEAMKNNTTGTSNVGIGYKAMTTNTSGLANVAMGYHALKNNTEGFSTVAIGYGAMENNTSGRHNTGIGYAALQQNTTGSYNVGLGYWSLAGNTTGIHNTGVGYFALGSNTTGIRNTGIGYFTLEDNTTGNYNTGLGYYSLVSNETGSYNTALGYQAGADAMGSYSIYLGNGAGAEDTSSYKLYIESSDADSTEALIFGEFDKDRLRINGTLNINGVFDFPIIDGTDGQILTTDGNGNLSWSSINTGEIAGSLTTTQTVSLEVQTAAITSSTNAEYGNSLWQTFTPTISGTASTISFHNSSGYPDSDLASGTLKIYEGSGTGGTEVASLSISADGMGWNSYDVTSQNLSLTAGTIYTLHIAGDNFDWSYYFDQFNDPYPGNTSNKGSNFAYMFEVKVGQTADGTILSVDDYGVSYNLIESLNFADGTVQTTAYTESSNAAFQQLEVRVQQLEAENAQLKVKLSELDQLKATLAQIQTQLRNFD